jgi:hypothetical protein
MINCKLLANALSMTSPAAFQPGRRSSSQTALPDLLSSEPAAPSFRFCRSRTQSAVLALELLLKPRSGGVNRIKNMRHSVSKIHSGFRVERASLAILLFACMTENRSDDGGTTISLRLRLLGACL